MAILSKFMRNSSTPAKAVSGPGRIGLDISADSIHLCQIRPLEFGLYSIVAKESIAYTGGRQALIASPKQLKTLIRQAFKRKNFKGRKVVALMPWDEVRMIMLTYKSSITDVDSEVVKMLSNRIEGDIDDYVVDYIPVRSKSSDEEHMVIATVAKKEDVNALLNALIECGLEVESLDIAPTALRRIVSTLYKGEAADNVLMINAYLDESYLTILSGRRLLLNQAVPFGENMLLERIAQELDVSAKAARELVKRHGLENRSSTPGHLGSSPVDDISSTLREILKPCFLKLVEEINRVLIFTASETHGVPVSRVCLLGGIANWPGARQLLLSLMESDAPDGQIEFAHIFQDEDEETMIPWLGLFSELSIAMGLALRGLEPNE
jgi:Tfp pilus assembly PilM family ATPase